MRVAGMVWMPKAEIGLEGVIRVKKDLTIIPRKVAYGDDKSDPTPVNCWAETVTEIGIPRAHFFKTSREKHEITWDLSDGRPTNITSLLRQEGPYAEQAVAVQSLMDMFKRFDETQASGENLGGILRATTGFGKTNTALEMIRRAGVTTIIIVHKEFLLSQWVKRIKKFLPDAKVGVCQGPKCEYQGMDIVVAMAQSLAREDADAPGRYSDEFYSYFGLLIVDEAHRIGAPTWSPIPQLFNAKYRIGLTATPRRKDGADKVFWWHIGEVVYTAKTETPKPDVKIINLDTQGAPYMHQQDAARAVVMKMLYQNTGRNRRILNELVAAMRSPQKRKVLVLSHFLDHLRMLERDFRERMKIEGLDPVSTDFYVGEWFSDEKTFSLYRRKDLGDDREKAIDALYKHFRRQKFFDCEEFVPDHPIHHVLEEMYGSKQPRCADTFDGKKYVVLYKHGHRPVCLDDVKDVGLVAMARDYDVAQKKSVEKKVTRTEAELMTAERARVIFATYQMCSEGVDIPAVDTLGLATPIGDVEQAFGRPRRNCVPVRHGGEMTPETCNHLCEWRASTCQGKPKPIVFDVVDITVPVANRSKRYRLDFYKDLGVKVSETRIH